MTIQTVGNARVQNVRVRRSLSQKYGDRSWVVPPVGANVTEEVRSGLTRRTSALTFKLFFRKIHSRFFFLHSETGLGIAGKSLHAPGTPLAATSLSLRRSELGTRTQRLGSLTLSMWARADHRSQVRRCRGYLVEPRGSNCKLLIAPGAGRWLLYCKQP